MLEGQDETPMTDSPAGSWASSGRTRLVLIGVVLVIALGYMVYAAFPGNTLYYLTVDEFVADEQNMDGRSLRIVGSLVPESLEWVRSSEPKANFLLTNEGEVLNATYHGAVLPELFDNPHSQIVLEGNYGEGDVFHSDTVIVKCPSKYRAKAES